jgi:hypothetical protein
MGLIKFEIKDILRVTEIESFEPKAALEKSGCEFDFPEAIQYAFNVLLKNCTPEFIQIRKQTIKDRESCYVMIKAIRDQIVKAIEDNAERVIIHDKD